MENQTMQEILDIIESALTLSGGYEVMAGAYANELLVIGPEDSGANYVMAVTSTAK